MRNEYVPFHCIHIIGHVLIVEGSLYKQPIKHEVLLLSLSDTVIQGSIAWRWGWIRLLASLCAFKGTFCLGILKTSSAPSERGCGQKMLGVYCSAWLAGNARKEGQRRPRAQP